LESSQIPEEGGANMGGALSKVSVVAIETGQGEPGVRGKGSYGLGGRKKKGAGEIASGRRRIFLGGKKGLIRGS